MKKIIINQSDRVIEWVAGKLDEGTIKRSIGIGLEKDGNLVAGVVFADQIGTSNIFMHVASDGSRNWMTPGYLAYCFLYPFVQLRCNRITGLVRSTNLNAQKFDEHLGFKKEGLLREYCADGTDMIVYGMLRNECRFITGKYHAAYQKLLGISGSTDFSIP